MNILIDINHPAHVHLFKHFALEMIKKGHKVFFTVMAKEMSVYLLQNYGFNYRVLGKNRKAVIKKILGMLTYCLKLFKIAKKKKIDVFVSHGSIYAAPVSFLLRKPHFAFEDTEHATVNNKICHIFTKNIITGNSYRKNLGKKQIRYKGNLELAYLKHRYFKPRKDIYELLKIKKNEKFVIVRFVSWSASHDLRQKGMSLDMKRKAVKELSKYAKVFISSEGELSEDLKPYQIKIPPERMHDALAHASLLYGESATMASECACLGTPAIYLDYAGRGYTDEEEEKYGLVFNFSESLKDQERSIKKGIEILKTSDSREEWHNRKEQMLKDKIDVTAFMVWFIENYPGSVEIMKADPDYQLRFI